MEKRKTVKISDFSGGVCLGSTESESRNKSPWLLNFIPYRRKGLRLRPGQRRESYGAGTVESLYERTYEGHFILKGTKDGVRGLYAKKAGSSAGVFLLRALSGAGKGVYFESGGFLYFVQDGVYGRIQKSGETLVFSDVLGYVPRVLKNCNLSSGKGDADENANLLTPLYKASYITNGTELQVSLPYYTSPANYSLITAAYKGSAITFSVRDEGTRTVLLLSSELPADASYDGGNTLTVTASRDEADALAKIAALKTARHSETLGGRILLSGGGSESGRVYLSEQAEKNHAAAEYFTFERSVSLDSEVTALSKLHGELVAFTKAACFGVEAKEKSLTPRELAGGMGCDIPYSVQRVENDVVFGNSARGLFLLTATGLSGERNIFPISGNIKEKLLSEEGLRDGFSINTGRGYLFCVNGSGYFWDYSLSPYKKSADLSKAENSLSWFLLSNLKANTLSVLSEECVGGDKDSFSLIFESGDHLDFGELIPGIYRSPLISGGDMARKKSVTMLSLSTETESHSEFSLCYLGDNVKIPGETVRTIKFSLYPMNLAAFSFAVPNHATVVCCRPNISDTNYFAFEIKATAPGAEISLLEASASLSLRGGRE